MKCFLFIFFFLFLAIPSSNPLSFNFTSFSMNDANIVYERCYPNPTTSAIELTTDSFASMGRATFAHPLHLWDNSTGNLTDFSTYFSFAIDSRNRSHYGDGLAFFLAPVGSKIPDDATRGATLGLVHDWQVINTTMDRGSNSSGDRFLAVEFDIYRNFFDPPGTHAGIDIDSMRSVVNTSWMSDVKTGKENRAWIDYDSRTHSLTVMFTGYRNDTGETVVLQNLSYVVDLRLRLPEWVAFGFSASTGNASAAHTVSAWNFSSTLDGETIIDAATSRTKGISKGTVTGIVIAFGGALLGILMLILLWRRRKRSRTAEKNEQIIRRYMGEGCPGNTGPKKFSYADLIKATGNFNPDSKLGEGGFGGVYKGYVKNMSMHVAVKRVSRGSKQGVKEYASEVKVISQLRHRNLVQLIGSCHEKQDELLLVYEFMANGSLDFHLYDSEIFSWEMRYRVARGLSSALLYLHEEWEQCIVHRDIKSSNVMLDSEFNAKLGDFGLARMIDYTKRSPTTALAGTFGYIAPECARTFRATKETDVYSFGVVCLEIVSARRPIEYREPEDPFVLVDWVYELQTQGEVLESVDPRLCGHFDEEQVERLVRVGLWCTHPEKHLRPSAGQANQALHFDVPVPAIPPRLHLPSFCIRNRNCTTSDSSSSCVNTSQIDYSSSTNNSSYSTKVI